MLAASASFTVVLEFADGSRATIVYAVDGASTLGKEYVEAHGAGHSALLDDFRTLRTFGEGRSARAGTDPATRDMERSSRSCASGWSEAYVETRPIPSQR